MARTSNDEGGKKGAVPGLDAAAPYVSRRSTRSALFTELHLLLETERSPLSPAEYRARIVRENKLSRASASARSKLWQELKSRYRLDAADPLFAAFWPEWRRCATDAERGLASLPERMQLAVEAGAKRILIPSENKRDLAEVPDAILTAIQWQFYDSPTKAAILAMGMG
ncbi:MAG: S16 family serine protease [Myxococcaceae bacterium]